jgi:hypothetical protein
VASTSATATWITRSSCRQAPPWPWPDAGRVILHGGLTRAQVTADAGQVSGTGLGRGSFTVATQVGEVDLAFASAPARVKVTTAAGAIDVTVPGGASYKVTTSSTVGDQDATVPNDANAANVIDLHAEVGHISLHQGWPARAPCLAVATRLGLNRGTVARWRARFLRDRLDGLSDEPRPGVPRTITDAQVEEVVVRTLEEVPEGAAHW